MTLQAALFLRDEFCPHLGGAFPTAWTDVDWATWLEYDLAVIDRCTHILMMERWATSAGAQKEREYAESIGKPVIASLEELPGRIVRLDEERTR